MKHLTTVVAKNGRDMSPDEMLVALLDGLQVVIGPFVKQPSDPKLYPVGGQKTHISVGKPFKGKAVYALLDHLDFMPTKSQISGAYGGYRRELTSEHTSVVYDNFSGIAVITSTIKSFRSPHGTLPIS